MLELTISKNSILELTKKLVSIPSTKDNPEALMRALFVTEEFLKNVPGVIIKKFTCQNLPSMVALTKDTLSPDILLVGHLDVVPGAAEQFQPIEKDGRLYGRGTCDMKSGVAVLMELFRNFASQNNPPNIGLMLTLDEETGGHNGVRFLVEEIGFRPKVAIIPDGGYAPDQLIIENKGIYHFQISAKGKSAHASRPWEGINAADEIIQALDRIRSIFEPAHSDTWRDTCIISKIQAGQAVNQVPDTAKATFDVRFVSETNEQKLLIKIEQAASPCSVEILVQAKASKTQAHHKFVELYKKELKRVSGLEIQLIQSPGGNDGRFFSAYGIPIIVSRPISWGMHGQAEWVHVEGLKEYASFYKSYLESLINLIALMKS